MEIRQKDLLQQLPQLDALLKEPRIQEFIKAAPLSLCKWSLQRTLSQLRQEILTSKRTELSKEDVLEKICRALALDIRPSFKKVINATGTVIHTNLGRSLLSTEVMPELYDAAFNYSNLEFNLEVGKRGSRYAHLVNLLKILTGAEDAVVVNNNAAAVLLVISTLSKEKETIISRGELVEIGGRFRIPDVMEMGGGRLREVGTTNKTHLEDYKNAVNEESAMLLKVHQSNFRMLGFTESVDIKDLAGLAHQKRLPLVYDVGSGLLISMQDFGLPYEPTIKECLDSGCDLVTFSGDKLLGGPQAGIIVGRKKYIQQIKQNQLLRALRIDKLSISALEATLRLYLEEKDKIIQSIPILKMLSMTVEDCRERAEKLVSLINKASLPLEVGLREASNIVGGGAYPAYSLPGYTVELSSRNISVNDFERALRQAKVAIVSRIKNDRVCLDIRTINEEDYSFIVSALKNITKIL